MNQYDFVSETDMVVGPTLGVYLCREDAVVPEFGTRDAACFDIRAHLQGVVEVSGYDEDNEKVQVPVLDINGIMQIQLEPLHRLMIPTGLIFDIPQGYSVRFHPRSGLSLKEGVVLGNMEAVIDSDYVNESMVILTNTSAVPVTIRHGDRVCQGELVEHLSVAIQQISSAPGQKTDRVGGFGSTGKK